MRNPDKEWIGVDLDKTLAHYTTWIATKHGSGNIGPPIQKMVDRIRKWLAEGKRVKIFTARVGIKNKRAALVEKMYIRRWCKKHIGQVLPITCKKDPDMIEMWDDSAVQVVPNTGERVDGRV